jgi:hypothetical protein
MSGRGRSLVRAFKHGNNTGRLMAAAIASIAPGHAAAQTATAHILLEASQAAPARDLLDSMGVNTHFGFLDSPYALRFAEVKAKLADLGLHHVRDTLTPRARELAAAGILSTVLLEPNTTLPDAAVAGIKTLNAHGVIVDTVEGANEPDMFWQRLGILYHGQGYPTGVAAYQRDLYRAFKADPATRSLPVIGVSLGLAGMANATPPRALDGLRASVDWGDVHPYPYNGNPFAPDRRYGGLASFYRQGTFPSVNVDEYPVALRAYVPIYGKGPMASTETGYPAGPHFTSEALQARYIPRLFAEHFRLGFKRTYLYQFADSSRDATGRNPDGCFGLLRYDLSERPAYRSLRRFAHVLAEAAGPGGAVPAGLGFQLIVHGQGDFSDAARVHHILLSRPDGSLVLLLWDEVSGEDASTDPRLPVSVPRLAAELVPSKPVVLRVRDMDGGEGKQIVATPRLPLQFSVPDSVIALDLGGIGRAFGAR